MITVLLSFVSKITYFSLLSSKYILAESIFSSLFKVRYILSFETTSILLCKWIISVYSVIKYIFKDL